nr:MAG TPA: hypothetical protein [Caudoviricetes sp.]
MRLYFCFLLARKNQQKEGVLFLLWMSHLFYSSCRH